MAVERINNKALLVACAVCHARNYLEVENSRTVCPECMSGLYVNSDTNKHAFEIARGTAASGITVSKGEEDLFRRAGVAANHGKPPRALRPEKTGNRLLDL
jgi:hypothetical protein